MLGVERASLLGTEQNGNCVYSVERPMLAVTMTGNAGGGERAGTRKRGSNG